MKTNIIGLVLGCLCCSIGVHGQQYVISTIAGGAPPETPVAAASAFIAAPEGIAADAAGNLFLASLNCIFKLDQNGVITRVAGNSRPGFSGDGGLAVNAQMNNPEGPAVDGFGNLYVADNNRVRRVSPSGVIVTIAGNGSPGYSGDGGPATSARLYAPRGVAVDDVGNVYIADFCRIRKVSPDGIITTVAGNGNPGYSGDGGPAIMAEIDPFGIAIDQAGNIYTVEASSFRIRRISPEGVIDTVAGTSERGYSGDGGPATSARLGFPNAIAIDGNGNLYIADSSNFVIRRVSTAGVISTVAGNGFYGNSGDGGLATAGALNSPSYLAIDSAGSLYITDGRIRKVTTDGKISTVMVNMPAGLSGDGGPAASAHLIGLYGVAADADGNLFIADSGNGSIRKVSPDHIITTVAGTGISGFSGDGGPAISARLDFPAGIAVDGAGSLYIADLVNSRIRKVSPDGVISTVAGTGSPGFSGDGGPATAAQLSSPFGIAVDRAGNLYIADLNNSRIRKVSFQGTITTVAGNGIPGFSGDEGPAISAQLNYPSGVDIDPAGNLYIVDGQTRIRRVSLDGKITTVAGNGLQGYAGEGGPATSAPLSYVSGVSASGGSLYIVEKAHSRVLKVSSGGILTTIAGNGVAGYSGDGGSPTNAQIYWPNAVTVGGAGNIYVADTSGAVRLLRPTNQSVLIGAVLDAASESAIPVSPGKIVAIYGAGLGPSSLVANQPLNGAFGTHIGGTTVSFNGIAAPIIYASATQVAAIAPYGISGSTAQVVVSYQGQVSSAFPVAVAATAPSFFSLNGSGAGQVAAVNVDGSLNDAAHPVPIGGYVSLYVTGEGQTWPAGVDGKLALTPPYPQPLLPVQITVGGLIAKLTYAAAAPTEVAGLMQIVAQIPEGVQPGGYVPVVLQVGDNSTIDGAAWIAVSAN